MSIATISLTILNIAIYFHSLPTILKSAMVAIFNHAILSKSYHKNKK